MRRVTDLPTHGLDASERLSLLAALAERGVSHLPVRIERNHQATEKWIDGERLSRGAQEDGSRGIAHDLGVWLRRLHDAGSSILPTSVDRRLWAGSYVEMAQRLTGVAPRDSDIEIGWVHSDLHPGNLLVTTAPPAPAALIGVIDWEYVRIGWTLFDVADALWRVCGWGDLPSKRLLQITADSRALLEGYGATRTEKRILLGALASLLELRGGYLRDVVAAGQREFAPALGGVESMERALRDHAPVLYDILGVEQ